MDRDFVAAKVTETIPCPVCDSTDFESMYSIQDYEYELPGEFNISRCLECNLIIQNPRPVFSEILRYYTEKYEPYRQVGSSLVRLARHLVLVQPRINLYQKLIGKKGTIVDVGCSAGSLLLDLRKSSNDWQLLGVEPVTEIAEYARAAGLDVKACTLEEANIAEASVDVAIMNHVLEHLPDPELTTSFVYKMLKPGAYFVGEIPSPQCLERFVFGKYWGGYHIPRHLTYFSPKHIKLFLKKRGFENISVSFQQQPSAVLLSISNFLKDVKAPSWLKSFFSPHSLLWLLVLTPFSFLLSLIGSASIIHFKAQKPLKI